MNRVMPQNWASLLLIEKRYGFPITTEIARAICTYHYDENIDARIFYGDLVDISKDGDGIFNDFQMKNRKELLEKMC